VVLAAATPRQLSANAVITNQDHVADHMFLVTSGRARHFFVSEDGRKSILCWLTPGDVFGAATLLARPCKYLLSTETVQDSSVLVWDRTTIRDIAARHPRVTDNALWVAYDYLTLYVADHVALTRHSASERLAQLLIRLSAVMGRTVRGGVEFDVTNEELATAANINPFTASRLLSRWQRDGAVIKRRGKILLRSPHRLLRKAR
jgi:CRP-like cAMP-binding protein